MTALLSVWTMMMPSTFRASMARTCSNWRLSSLSEIAWTISIAAPGQVLLDDIKPCHPERRIQAVEQHGDSLLALRLDVDRQAGRTGRDEGSKRELPPRELPVSFIVFPPCRGFCRLVCLYSHHTSWD